MTGTKYVRGVTLLAAGALLLVASGCTPSGSASGQSAELVKSKCTLCHTVERIDQAKKDRAGWEQTIVRMRAKGAVLTDAEAAQLADYLSQKSATD